MLQSYFRSGWAFLIPYLAAYLLYAWLKWPVNPAIGEGIVKGISESVGASSSMLPAPYSFLQPPALLHVYWFLHALHLLLGGLALAAWWRGSDAAPLNGDRPLDIVYRQLPWILLGVLFYIPATYLELPSDTWAHYIRITEWSSVQQVTQHSTWLKFSYFLGFTLIDGGASSLSAQLVRLDIFYTSCCLLLCWQYYRLSRAVGLAHRSALVFVFLQSLLFGNGTFGFYRYYGISSSLFGQLGAVALVRIMIDALQGTAEHERKGMRLLRRAGRCAIAAVPLLLFTALNHKQALGMAVIGIAAVVAWWLVERRRAMIGWIFLSAAVINTVAVAWFPRVPALDTLYRPGGWLTALYGFNLFSPASPAWDRTIVILGWAGVLNLFASLVLLRRNTLASWLALFPVVALCMPCVAIPLANMLSQHNADPANIMTFHRLLLGIPAGLSIVLLGSALLERNGFRPVDDRPGRQGLLLLSTLYQRTEGPFLALLLVLLFLVTAPGGATGFNRLYHTWVKIPDDLGARPAIRIIEAVAPMLPHSAREVRLAFGELIYAARRSTPSTQFRSDFRITSYKSASQPQSDILAFLRFAPEQIYIPLTGRELYSPMSIVACLSGHWAPQTAATGTMGGPEFVREAASLGYKKLNHVVPRLYLHQFYGVDPAHR